MFQWICDGNLLTVKYCNTLSTNLQYPIIFWSRNVAHDCIMYTAYAAKGILYYTIKFEGSGLGQYIFLIRMPGC